MPRLTIQNLKSLEETDWIEERRGATIVLEKTFVSEHV